MEAKVIHLSKPQPWSNNLHCSVEERIDGFISDYKKLLKISQCNLASALNSTNSYNIEFWRKEVKSYKEYISYWEKRKRRPESKLIVSWKRKEN